MYFQPLNYNDALALLKYTFPEKIVEVDVDSNSPEQVFPITGFTKEKFTQLVHVTGGVPRYLVEYCETGKHYLMPEELSCQFDDVLLKLTPEKVCELIVRIETTRMIYPNPLAS